MPPEATPSTNESTQGGEAPSGETPTAGDEFKPITSQDDLNKVISERITRERAKYSDYKDVKAKAARLDEIEAANQTEAEKAAERLKVAEKVAEDAQRDASRWKIAAKYGVTDEDADLFLTGSDEETLTKQAERLTERVAAQKKNGNHVSREGTNPQAKPDEMTRFTRGSSASAT